MLKTLLSLGFVLSILSASAAEAHGGKERMKFSCDEDGCTITAVKHKHHHHGHRHRPNKMRFVGNVCDYKPRRNITVCRY